MPTVPKPDLVDLSHTVEHGMISYPGFPAPIICDWLSREQSRAKYAPGTEFQIGRIDMIGNTGTYLDSPFHRYADGSDVADIPIERVAGLDTVVIDAAHGRATSADALRALRGRIRGKAVLVRTGWDRHWRTDRYFEGHPFLTAEAAELLRDEEVGLVGIDSLNIDDTTTGERPVHTILLRAGIYIVEHLRGLDQLPPQGSRFSAVPVKVRGMGTFPVRAFASITPP